MSWTIPNGYSAPDLNAIQVSMNGVTTPAVNGTILAMRPIVFEGKTPFHSSNGTGETATTAPLTPPQARRAFDMRIVHDDLVASIADIAREDGHTNLANI